MSAASVAAMFVHQDPTRSRRKVIAKTLRPKMGEFLTTIRHMRKEQMGQHVADARQDQADVGMAAAVTLIGIRYLGLDMLMVY
jgi:hypothetical protein